ncbi:hypothetical protein MHYP_G00130820 [Metynnis hypsauchen]
MAEEVLQNEGAGSVPEPEASAVSQNSCFLQSLTDRQLQVMLGGLHQMFTRDDITRLSTDIEKIVTTVSQKVIIPGLCEEEPTMAEEVLQNEGAGSVPEPEASAVSQNSCFLQSLTDRQLQVMLGGLHQMFTRDDITRLSTDIEKIVTTVSQKVIIPALCEDAKTLPKEIQEGQC